MVYLVGAGPGDPGLLTCKGKTLLEESDAVIYDRLGTGELLEEVKEDCKKKNKKLIKFKLNYKE